VAAAQLFDVPRIADRHYAALHAELLPRGDQAAVRE
jgi:hypothetical protein